MGQAGARTAGAAGAAVLTAGHVKAAQSTAGQLQWQAVHHHLGPGVYYQNHVWVIKFSTLQMNTQFFPAGKQLIFNQKSIFYILDVFFTIFSKPSEPKRKKVYLVPRGFVITLNSNYRGEFNSSGFLIAYNFFDD